MMKKLIFVSLILVILIGNAFAQADTVMVPAEDESGNPLVNSIIDYVVADTNDSGEQLHKVYKLSNSKVYMLDKAVVISNPVHIVAGNPTTEAPQPKIISVANEAGDAAATNEFFKVYADFKLQNVWLGGICTNGWNRSWGANGAVNALEPGISITLDGIWVDYFSWSSIGASVPNTKWYISNLHVRNAIQWEPWTTFGLYFEGAQQVDSLVIENSTIFNHNGPAIFLASEMGYLEVNHCTFVNGVKWPFLPIYRQTNVKITNNVFYNTNYMGQTMGERKGHEPDLLANSIINIDTLASNLSDTMETIMPESERTYIVKNNACYWSEAVTEYWANNDSVLSSPDNQWMNSRTEAMFADDENYPNLVAENNWVNVDPQFDQFDDLAAATDSCIKNVKNQRAGVGWDYTVYEYDSDKEEYPDFFRVMYEYPLAENFHHATEMLGTDGKPIGDLNYYPDYDPLAIDNSNDDNLANNFSLEQNYPNPFNPTTTIEFSLNKPGKVTLTVYNVLGEKVKTLYEGSSPAEHSIEWNGRNDAGKMVPSGVYFYKLKGANITKVRKMLFVK